MFRKRLADRKKMNNVNRSQVFSNDLSENLLKEASPQYD